jgi:uncharacterized protein YjeT (DUF2065 family)
MTDLLVAIGLVLVIEGLVFAAAPGMAKRMAATVLEVPEQMMRVSGIIGAVAGLALVWLIRG